MLISAARSAQDWLRDLEKMRGTREKKSSAGWIANVDADEEMSMSLWREDVFQELHNSGPIIDWRGSKLGGIYGSPTSGQTTSGKEERETEGVREICEAREDFPPCKATPGFVRVSLTSILLRIFSIRSLSLTPRPLRFQRNVI